MFSCTVAPCMAIDNCAGAEHAVASSDNEEDDCKDCCSPFSICSSACEFTYANHQVSFEAVEFIFPVKYSDVYISFN